MTYKKTDVIRSKVIAIIEDTTRTQRFMRPPAYKTICEQLAENGITTGYGRRFDPTTLYAFLYRSGYSGLWGVVQHMKETS